MDKYLFRGKRTDDSEWVYGGVEVQDERYAAIYDRDLPYDNENRVKPWTVGQCTGLKDKGGKLIYEGDIVRDLYDRVMRVEYSVHFQQMRLFPISENCKNILNMSKDYGCEIFSWTYPKMHLTVIGNIHDNPELLQSA